MDNRWKDGWNDGWMEEGILPLNQFHPFLELFHNFKKCVIMVCKKTGLNDFHTVCLKTKGKMD